jgi:hypothetical protein
MGHEKKSGLGRQFPVTVFTGAAYTHDLTDKWLAPDGSKEKKSSSF